MSNRRALTFLLMALLVVVGAHVWLDFFRPARTEVVRRRSLLSASDNAVAYEFSGAGRGVFRLEKTDRWRIVLPFRAVADQSAVARLSDVLAFSPVVDALNDADALKLGRTRADFGLEVPRLKLKVISASGEDTVVFGDAVHSGEGVYAAVEGFPTVYIVPSEVFAAANISVDAWRRKSVFRVTSDEVQSIAIRRGENAAAVRLEKQGERWEITEPHRAMASATAVKRILETVLSCEARKFVWPVGASNETVTASVALLAGFGLDQESCETVVFRAADGRDYSISFGSAADSDSVYALVQGGTAIATVPSVAKEVVSIDDGALIDGRLFPLEKSTIQQVSILDGDTLYLLARGDNGSWRLDSPVSAAADEAAVSTMLDKLLVMRAADIREGGVKVSLANDAPAVAVSKEAFLGSGGFEQLRSKSVLEIDPATVKRLVVTSIGASKPASVVFDPDRKGWNVEASGRPGVVDPKRLAAFLSELSPLKAKSVARLKVAPGELAGYGLENPRFTIAVDRLLEDSVRRNILLGNVLNEDGDTYATVGSSDAVFVLDGATVSVLVAGVLDE